MGILLTRIQRHMTSSRGHEDASEGEIVEHVRGHHVDRSRGLREETLAPGKEKVSE